MISNRKGVSGLVWAVFIVIFVMTIFGFLIDDFELNYVDTGISNVTRVNESLKSTFSNASEINETFSGIEEGFRDIREREGFFEGLGDLVIDVPTAIIRVPLAMFDMLGIAGRVAIEMLNQLGIPPTVILIISIALLVYMIFKLIEFWRRYPTGG